MTKPNLIAPSETYSTKFPFQDIFHKFFMCIPFAQGTLFEAGPSRPYYPSFQVQCYKLSLTQTGASAQICANLWKSSQAGLMHRAIESRLSRPCYPYLPKCKPQAQDQLKRALQGNLAQKSLKYSTRWGQLRRASTHLQDPQSFERAQNQCAK